MPAPAAPGASEAGPIEPAQALRPGTGDATTLLWVWIVRRSCTGLVFLGLVVGVVLAGVSDRDAELHVDPTSADSVVRGIVTSFGLVFVAIALRLLTGWVALGLAYPLARVHQGELGARPGLRRRVAILLDRGAVARAFRELRWTEGVRAAAHARLGPAGRLHARLERAVGIGNVVAGVVCVLAVVGFGLTVEV